MPSHLSFTLQERVPSYVNVSFERSIASLAAFTEGADGEPTSDL